MKPGGHAASAPLPTGSSVGALWVAGLGAFLLVAAAVTFVTVRWDEIPAGAKLGALVVLTGVCFASERPVRRPLPATATVLFHLGLLLVPVDVAALGVRAGWGWHTMLFAQGAAGTIVFGWGAWSRRSIVLRAAAWVAMVLLCGGIGGMTVVPAGLVLAAVGLAACLSRRSSLELAALGWAGLAGLATPLSGAEHLGIPGGGVLTDLGLAGNQPPVAASVAGLVAGVALGLLGERRRNVPAALAGIGSGLVAGVTAWASLQPDRPAEAPDEAALAAVAGLVLVAEIAARVWRSDPFWSQPTAIVADLGEVVAAFITIGLVGVLIDAVAGVDRVPLAGVAAALVARTWISAMERRRVPGRSMVWGVGTLAPRLPGVVVFGPFAVAVSASASAALLSGSDLVTAAALAVAGSAVVLLGPRLARGSTTSPVLAIGLLALASTMLHRSELAAAALGYSGALVVAVAVVLLTTWMPPPWVPRQSTILTAQAHSFLAFVLWGIGWGWVDAGAGPTAGVTSAIVGAWLLAEVLDVAVLNLPTTPLAGPTRGSVGAGGWRLAGVLNPTMPDLASTPRAASAALPPLDARVVTRLMLLVPLLAFEQLSAGERAAVACLAGVLTLLDAVRVDRPILLLGTGLMLAVTAHGLATDLGADAIEAGVAVTLLGAVWLLVAWLAPERWAPFALISAGISAAYGFVLCAQETVWMATYLLVVGMVVAAAGAVLDRRDVLVVGAGMGLVGYWIHLALAGIDASEPYVAPAALVALAGGLALRKQQPQISSWLAYAPAVAVLGSVALMERLAGGSAWHGLAAGAVGVAAVVVGGGSRLAGPLMVGTALVVATTVHETLDVTARIPTWAWMGIGGAVLLGAGIAMERRATGPVDTGRRLVDVVRTRFT